MLSEQLLMVSEQVQRNASNFRSLRASFRLSSKNRGDGAKFQFSEQI